MKNKKAVDLLFSTEYEGNIPTVNSYWKHNRDGHTYISTQGRAFKECIRYLCLSQKIKVTDQHVKVFIEVSFKKKGRDIDNVVKPILDAMEGFVYSNDNQVDEICIKRRYHKLDKLDIKVYGQCT